MEVRVRVQRPATYSLKRLGLCPWMETFSVCHIIPTQRLFLASFGSDPPGFFSQGNTCLQPKNFSVAIICTPGPVKWNQTVSFMLLVTPSVGTEAWSVFQTKARAHLQTGCLRQSVWSQPPLLRQKFTCKAAQRALVKMPTVRTLYNWDALRFV